MHTARSSSHPGGGFSTRHPPRDQAPPGPGTPPCEQNHTGLWKYNLAPTLLRAVKIGVLWIARHLMICVRIGEEKLERNIYFKSP